MINQQRIKKRNFFFLTLLLLSTTFFSSRTLKNIEVKDIKIYGSNFFSKKDLLKNSSLNLKTRLFLINTKLIEKELKQNLSLKNVSVNRQILPFGLKVFIKPRSPIAYAEKIFNDKKISGFVDEDGFFIYEIHTENIDLDQSALKVYGWQKTFRKTLSEIFIYQKNGDLELAKIRFSQNGFLTLEEKDLKTILLGFNPNLVRYQLPIISSLKKQLKKNNFFDKIDNIDLTDPKYPKIKVFKP